MSSQKIIVIGNLGKDAEIKTFKDNKQFLAFSVSVSNGKNADGSYRDATWFECLYGYNPQTQSWLTERLKKGVTVYIEGRVSARAYIDKNNQPVGQLSLMANVLDPIGMIEKPQQAPLQSNYGLNNPPYQVPQYQAPQGYQQAPPQPQQGYQQAPQQGGYVPQQQMQGGYAPQSNNQVIKQEGARVDEHGQPLPF